MRINVDSINKFYYLANRDIVRIISVIDEAWGITAKYYTGKNEGTTDTWDDTATPHLMSFDIDEAQYSLTIEEVSKEEHPEYYL
ncbi:MAG: hypothetical protein J7L15_04685 [Clostridiales bacterium]|nr:hypothetical protein [Clostridiales bacterium]